MQEDVGCLPEADQPASYLGSASRDLNGADCIPWNTAVTGEFTRNIEVKITIRNGAAWKAFTQSTLQYSRIWTYGTKQQRDDCIYVKKRRTSDLRS
jgi:hypothetical protein